MLRHQNTMLVFPLLAALAAGGTPCCGQEVTRVDAFEAKLNVLRESPISAEVTGTLVTVSPTVEGVLVKKDETLVRLNDAVVKAELDYAETQATQTTEIEFAKESLELAKANKDQKVAANARVPGVFTPQEMRTMEQEVKKAFAQVRKSEDDQILHQKTVETKKAQLAQYTVRAPFDGQITKIHRYPGQNVRPGDPILTLTDMSVLKGEVKVNFKARHLLYVGDEVEFRIDSTAKTLDDSRPETTAREAAADDGEARSSFFGGGLNNSGSKKGGPNAGQFDEPQRSAESVVVYKGVIMFIEPQISRGSGNEAYVSLNVHVPNPQDQFGRYELQEGIPVKAVVLSKKRSPGR